MDVVQRVACKAIIVRDGKILLMRESAAHGDNTKVGQYQFPGGQIEPGEPFIEGLFREVEEETQLKIEVGEPFFVGEWFPVVRGQKRHIVGIFFACKYVSGEVVVSEEHDGYEWVDLAQAEQLNIMVPDNQVAQKYLASIV